MTILKIYIYIIGLTYTKIQVYLAAYISVFNADLYM